MHEEDDAKINQNLYFKANCHLVYVRRGESIIVGDTAEDGVINSQIPLNDKAGVAVVTIGVL